MSEVISLSVLVRVSSVIKHHKQKQLVEERVYFTFQLSSSKHPLTEESQDRNSRQEPGSRN